MLRVACAIALLALPPGGAAADMIVSVRTIRAQEVIGKQDITLKAGEMPGVAAHPADLVGKEARVALYAGRPIRLADVGAPALVERNQIVTLVFNHGGLLILAEGRSLSRAGVGEPVRAMNLASRNTVSGRVGADGRIHVSP
ncbi:flagellar basal body P-ring formation chaperone FlgA [Roseovarius amoyensis]|uniref:flagellar basal body P-ring formation chaperone FlgA n=1 Tax=Roseovarius amoyensis TaxID=2211448 RepID=UPI000DBE20D2|nr:flagellar basal body P-ring formation chaperone FlgA [Roseovarius amoyensis]